MDTGGDGVPHFFRQGGRVPHFFRLKFVQKLVQCCNWLLTETQCKIISVKQNLISICYRHSNTSSCIAGQDQRSAVAIFLTCTSVRVCRPKLFKNLRLSLVSGVPHFFTTTPLLGAPLVRTPMRIIYNISAYMTDFSLLGNFLRKPVRSYISLSQAMRFIVERQCSNHKVLVNHHHHHHGLLRRRNNHFWYKPVRTNRRQ